MVFRKRILVPIGGVESNRSKNCVLYLQGKDHGIHESMRTLEIREVLKIEFWIGVHYLLAESDGIACQSLAYVDPILAKLLGVFSRHHRRMNDVVLLVLQINDTARERHN